MGQFVLWYLLIGCLVVALWAAMAAVIARWRSRAGLDPTRDVPSPVALALTIPIWPLQALLMIWWVLNYVRTYWSMWWTLRKLKGGALTEEDLLQQARRHGS